jgi:hypothetical protein
MDTGETLTVEVRANPSFRPHNICTVSKYIEEGY